MAWFGRSKDSEAAEALLMAGFYASTLAASESYDAAMNRVDEGDVFKLFGKLRSNHLDFADDFKKRVKKLGRDPEDRTGVMEQATRTITRIQGAGSIRDLLIAMRQGEENGVAMCREALEEADLSGKSRSLIESYNHAHIDHIRDLSEQIALRGTYVGTSAEFFAPQWLRYPKPAFWVLEAALVGLGFVFGRGGRNKQGRTSPRADLAYQESQESMASREVGR
ncbi:MAG TPA: DUF2383 domain-containing protein [Herpetosiphonaceae bacterium]